MTPSDPHRRGTLFWLSAAIGWGLIAWGVRGALHQHIDTRPGELARFFLAGPLVHDLIVSPIVLAAGYAVATLIRPRWRAYVQAATIISAVLGLFAYPEIRDYARILHNPTSLPHNYAANLAVVVAVVWMLTIFVALARSHRR